ncbi:TIR domain-containing protein [Undibacterium sp. Ji67W]|uniref:TIR domain-containing protein n=1 Tax=Undibacterium sp. Ji67W TaxID=3413042 RepID=UPI003BF3DCBF
MKKDLQRTVFYSWQADSQSNLNRNVIEKAIESAIKRSNASIEDTQKKYYFDKDILNQPGSPDINEVLLRKIDQCSVFVSDVTPIAEIQNGKAIPNSNVLFETGYAVGKKGLNRVILIMNSHEHAVEKLPFDLKTKAILKYELSNEDLNQEGKKSDIVKNLSSGIKTTLDILANEPEPVNEEPDSDVQEKIKHERDAIKIIRLLKNLPISVIQNLVIDGKEHGIMNFDVFTAYYNLQAVYGYSGFRLYDKETKTIIDTFMSKLDTSLSFGENFFYYRDAIYKFRPNSKYSLMDYIDTLEELSLALTNLLDHIHENFLEINMEEMDGEALAAYKKEISERN